jgi:hypothetical protein
MIAVTLVGAASGAQLMATNATVAVAPRALETQKACEGACGPNADVTCYTECEVDLYRCFDIHEGEAKCKETALTKYGSFVATWNAVALHAQNSTASRKVQEKCAGVCGADSICRTACEVDMYECFDTNTPKTEDKIESCQADALKTHKGAVSFLLGHEDIVKAGVDDCSAVCKDSFCTTQCEVMMYECFDTNTPQTEDKIKACQKAAVEFVKTEYKASFINTHNLLVRHNSGDWAAHILKAEDRHHAQEKCNQVCGIDAQCASSCEVEMYTCFDVNTPTSEDKIKDCQDAALEAHKNYRVASLLAEIQELKSTKFLA